MEKDRMKQCTQQLLALSRALDAYQRDHREPPPHLSDLYPQYLGEKELLHCPADPSAGDPRFEELADPNMPISYVYWLNTDQVPSPVLSRRFPHRCAA